MLSLKEMVKDQKKVHFSFYRKGELWYKTEDGFEFPVPISDCGDAVFLNEDKAILFMRYIRKHLENIGEGKQNNYGGIANELADVPPIEHIVGKEFYFPVPIADTGDAVFLHEDKAILFMRYIRKHLENIEAGKEEAKTL